MSVSVVQQGLDRRLLGVGLTAAPESDEPVY